MYHRRRVSVYIQGEAATVGVTETIRGSDMVQSTRGTFLLIRQDGIWKIDSFFNGI